MSAKQNQVVIWVKEKESEGYIPFAIGEQVAGDGKGVSLLDLEPVSDVLRDTLSRLDCKVKIRTVGGSD